jgi:hypothetical protein
VQWNAHGVLRNTDAVGSGRHVRLAHSGHRVRVVVSSIVVVKTETVLKFVIASLFLSGGIASVSFYIGREAGNKESRAIMEHEAIDAGAAEYRILPKEFNYERSFTWKNCCPK